MKEKIIYKSIIKDVIIASGGEITDEGFNKLKLLFSKYNPALSMGEITDEGFNKLKLLFSKYNLALSMEEMTEEDYNESV